MKPEQPGPANYTPTTASHPLKFIYTWKSVRVNPQNLDPATFPFHLELAPGQTRYTIRFLEFRAHFDPPKHDLDSDIGNPGDVWLNVSPAAYAVFALSKRRAWVRWAGPAPALAHPYLPLYALWCTLKQASWYHRAKLAGDWTPEKLASRRELGGYAASESMYEPAVSVRLILLREEVERRVCAES
ncbi:hypothetical protein C8R47DRAFT_1101804, partial [Mycena vitilis]